MKRKLRVTFFAVAITVLLLIALTMNSVSVESKAKVNLGPTDAAKVKLNPSDAAKVKLNSTDAAKVALNPSESMTFPTERALNELIYDDGTAENAYAWTSAGNGFAVRFTPLSYPVDILTARICFEPDWPSSNHEEFAVYVYDDDGPSGEPGTCLGGPIDHTATAWGWCDVDISGLGITIEDGDFYILYKQLTDDPDCEGLCVDESPPHYGRSWDYVGGSWDPWWDENYMIRCVVDDDATDEWTYMVYLDGDNDLEGAAIDDFMEMSSVGSSPTVNIVVQFDRIPGYDSSYGGWTDCKRFYVWPGMTPTAANAISDLGECNMGDPSTLDEFVTWAMTNYPANNYALILWNHGSGWKKWKWNDPEPDIGRGVCWDETSGGDYLTLRETEQALTGKYVDLLGYDANLMHMMAVVYQVRANAGVSVGSEEYEPPDGWPYDTILADLTVTPTMDEYTLGRVIVDRYMDSYGYAGSETQSAIDNSALPNLVTAVDNLAQALITEINGGNWAQVEEARNAAAEMMHDNDYIDLYHFAEMVHTYVPGAVAEAQAVMNEVSWSMYEAHGSSVPNDHGLSIYYPRVEGDYFASYDNTSFASDTNWNEFLKEYYNPPTQGGDIGVFRNGKWILRSYNLSGPVVYRFNYGNPTDVPVTGDWNGDGECTIGVYRNGQWILRDNNSAGAADYRFNYGNPTDVPVTGDWDGDGECTIGVYRNGRWILRDSNSAGSADYRFNYGNPTDVPVTGDWDGDGETGIGVRRDGQWIFRNDKSAGASDYRFNFGNPSDVPVTGDWNGDGECTIGVYRNGQWILRNSNSAGDADYRLDYGNPTDKPVTGDWN